MDLHELRLLHVSSCFLLVELHKFFLMIENFLEKFFPSRPSSQFLTTSHLLLKSVNCSSFFLVMSLNSGAFVKLTVNQLSLKQIVTLGFCHNLFIYILISFVA